MLMGSGNRLLGLGLKLYWLADVGVQSFSMGNSNALSNYELCGIRQANRVGGAVIKAVLSMLVECVGEQLMEGKRVGLGELGLQLSSEGVDDPKDFKAKNITDVKVVWTSGPMLKDLKDEAKFREVMPRRDQAQLRKRVNHS